MAEDLESRKRSLESLSKDQLVERLAGLELMVERLGPEAQFWMNCLYQMVAVKDRSHTWLTGVLNRVQLTVSEVELLRDVSYRDYATGTTIKELKTTRIPGNQIIGFELIHERKELPKEESGP